VASPARKRLVRRWRAVRQLSVVAAVVACVAGCVGMPDGGPPAEFGANAQATQPSALSIAPIPSQPQPGATPSQIVHGFLVASASGPSYAEIARQYLADSAAKAWNPGTSVTVFSGLDTVPEAVTSAGRHGPQQTVVDVSGVEQATFDGSGQYVWAQRQSQSFGRYPFNLAKVDGQWRITNPPRYRMLTATEFPLYYQAQDLYFFDPDDEVLVPDSVFVPLDIPPQALVKNLVEALIQGPRTAWLQDATDTDVFPAGTAVLGVALSGPEAVVNLGGAIARADPRVLAHISAQLVWTLTGLPVGASSSIQSVELEINGAVWTPSASLCPAGRGPSSLPTQTQADYECDNPYPAAPASFYYVGGGQAWSRCGAESQARQGSIGLVVPVVARTGDFSSAQCANGFAQEGSAPQPPAQSRSLPAMSMAAVSPDGKYLAVVSPGKDALYIGTRSGDATSFPATPRLVGSDITALSWDRNDELWVVQGGGIFVVPIGGKPAPVTFGGENVTDLSVAPDGVRIAVVVQNGPNTELELAAINSGGQPVGRPSLQVSLTPGAPLGPGITHPVSLTWYDADDLIVLDAAAGGPTLWEVPVDGQQAVEQPPPPANAVSITADSAANALVAGLTGGELAVSAVPEGPWTTLNNPGQDPAYPG
jgi:Lipoprotein LpqB beta-propeller domain/Sporulation and spore germination